MWPATSLGRSARCPARAKAWCRDPVPAGAPRPEQFSSSLSQSDEPRTRGPRRDSKLFNERLKLTANVLNASCIGVLGAAVIFPAANDAGLRPSAVVWLIVAGV